MSKRGRSGINARDARRFTPFVFGANGCPRPDKKGYDTRAAAKAAARLYPAGARGAAGKLVPYLCTCGFFHVGHQGLHRHREDHGGQAAA